MRIESVKQAVVDLPITPRALASLRETARLFSTHYSTMIEGNMLTGEQVGQVIGRGQHFPGRDREEHEVKGYYAALDAVEQMAKGREAVSEMALRKLHGLVMGAGKVRIKPTPYRDGQNVIRDSRTGKMVYLPPEAKDISRLMVQLTAWINTNQDLPVPLKAGIAHYQYATIHPYYDGNGRTARLLATLILHAGNYDLKGIYALEEYYALDLTSYYGALDRGPSHNYYLGRARTDITPWVSYFIEGMAVSFEKVRGALVRESRRGAKDRVALLRNLDAKQKKALTLFAKSREIAAADIGKLFRYQSRTAALLCQRWVEAGFLDVADPSNKSRRYRLSPVYEAVVL